MYVYVSMCKLPCKYCWLASRANSGTIMKCNLAMIDVVLQYYAVLWKGEMFN